jgi:hypothetical protein
MTSISFPLCPLTVTGSLGSLTSLCKSIFLPDLIRRQNDPDDDFHLDFHKMVCIAFKTDGGTFVQLLLYVTLLCLTSDHVCRHRGQTTVHGHCESVHARRTGRQYLSRWANQTCVDTTFQFCNEAVNILVA